jgi:threonine/homoserine/homoserine lactone efflux protein
MSAPLATIAFASAAYLAWLAIRLTVREVGARRIRDALWRRPGR